jgi:hypothetical protein
MDVINKQGTESGLEKMFGNLENELEANAQSTGHEAEYLAKEDRWRQKRIGKITSSKLPDLMTSGRSKGQYWGLKAITAMLAVAHERRTGIERPTIRNVKAMEWGKQYEREALLFYCQKVGIEMLSCSDDFKDITFNEPFAGFGDSPDGITKDGIGCAEIKCPESGGIHLGYTVIKAFAEGDDYYWQMLGHMLPPLVEWCDFVSYDPRAKEDDPLKLHYVRIFKMDHASNMQRLQTRIDFANLVINEANAKNDMSIILNINNLPL